MTYNLDEAPSAATSPSGPEPAASLPPESATVVGSPSPPGANISRAQAAAIPGMLVQVRPPAPSVAAVVAVSGAPPSEGEAAEVEAEILRLVDRIPDVDVVLADVKRDSIVMGVLEDFDDVFPTDADREAILYKTELWEEVSGMLMDAIIKYTPIKEKDYDKKSKLYEGKKLDIVHKHVGSRRGGQQHLRYSGALLDLHAHCVLCLVLDDLSVPVPAGDAEPAPRRGAPAKVRCPAAVGHLRHRPGGQ